MKYEIHHSDCLAFMQTLPDNHVDAIVTDPPYGLSFMGKKWDYEVPSEDIWRECLRVLKPGGHLLAFAGTRTQHRMAVRIEDAGFEIRDMIAWVYGSGFPKSHNLKGDWQGWGTALKPALEPITVARKSLIGTVADNVLTWGTGGVNVDGCRVETVGDRANEKGGGQGAGYDAHNKQDRKYGAGLGGIVSEPHALGRWPANLIHDGSEEVVGLFPEQAGANGTHTQKKYLGNTQHLDGLGAHTPFYIDSKGSAARFFYCAKASKRDRDEGCEGMEAKRGTVGNKWTDQDYRRADTEPNVLRINHHPTVKPTDLMRYLCRLVTPPNGIVFDPFMGSGSTGKAAVLEGFNFIGCDMTAEYVDIARARIEHAAKTRPNTLFP